MYKKGQVSEQFNWVFALIAGAIILMFFLFVIAQVRMVQDAKLSASVLNNFDAILTGSDASPNTISIIDSTKDLSFTMSCDLDGNSELSIIDSGASIPLNNKIIFTPSIVNGEQIIIGVEPIKAPFYLANTLMITDTDTAFFVHVKDDDRPVLEEIYLKLPDNITKIISPLIQNRFKSFRKIVVITDYEPNLNDATLGKEWSIIKKKDVNWIVVSNDEAKFFTKGEDEREFRELGTVVFQREEHLNYLIFSQDINYYNCNLGKIKTKIKQVSKVYAKRSEYIYNIIGGTCKQHFYGATEQFTALTTSSNPFGEGITGKIENLNKRLVMMSCPLIY